MRPESKTTTLATGQINASDQLIIELVQATETPTMILIRWPAAPSVYDPRRFAATAVAVIAVVDQAVIALKAAELESSGLPVKGPIGSTNRRDHWLFRALCSSARLVRTHR